MAFVEFASPEDAATAMAKASAAHTRLEEPPVLTNCAAQIAHALRITAWHVRRNRMPVSTLGSS